VLVTFPRRSLDRPCPVCGARGHSCRKWLDGVVGVDERVVEAMSPGPLVSVKTTTASGIETTFRVRAGQEKRYMSAEPEPERPKRGRRRHQEPDETKERRPHSDEGDVETK
jgi:hypothetical protein